MKVINLTDGNISASGFEEEKVSSYFRSRFRGRFARLRLMSDPNLRTSDINEIVRLVKELDRRNCGKVVISSFMERPIIEELAKALLFQGYDTYTTNSTGKDVTLFDHPEHFQGAMQ